MIVVKARNVNRALPDGLRVIQQCGIPKDSRGGDVIEAVEPVTTVYHNPMERVLFSAARDANPFFHLFEALWILGGADRVDFLALFNPRMREYSDDGVVFNAPYGYRIKGQLERAIQLLRTSPETRRAALQIWDWHQDLGADSKDIPCNMMVALKLDAPKVGPPLLRA